MPLKFSLWKSTNIQQGRTPANSSSDCLTIQWLGNAFFSCAASLWNANGKSCLDEQGMEG